ncbi:hypothetical protein VNI00_016634 [Paramarasmius palmivorus]|uniref:Uncharacterized protein n=1 Tax=Paramarasmius palmivorus TaxID=297713 RepID=A0AAW0BBR3_9AGAR
MEEESPTVSSTEADLAQIRKRRATDDTNSSPSKIRVKDLTLSPRKMGSYHKHGTAEDQSEDEGIVKRASARSRKLTARVANAGGATTDLLSKLDALVPETESEGETKGRESDTSYKPLSPRKRALGRGGAVNKSIEPEPRDRIDADSDVSMRSPAVSGNEETVRIADIRPVSDTDEELPSPSTIFSRKGKAASAMDVRGKGRALSPVLTRVDARMSTKAASTPLKNKRAAESSVDVESSDDEAAAQLSSDAEGLFVAERVASSQANAVTNRANNGRVRSQRKDSANSPSKEGMDSGSSSYSGKDAVVFMSGVALPEDDEDDDYEDDGGPADVASKEVPVVPLLDRDCIHPDLMELYDSLTWINSLRRAKFIGYSNTEDAFDDFVPVSYGGVVEKVINRVRSKLVRSMVFVEYRDFKSPVRIPLMSFVRSWECIRVPHAQGTQNAVFVLTGICHRSFVAQGREVGESYVKQLHIRPVENDWIIFQCNLGTYFNDNQMHAPGRYSAVVFQTKRQGWSARRNDRDSDKLASTPYSSPAKAGSSSSSGPRREAERSGASKVASRGVAGVNVMVGGAPPYRLFDDGIPLYDGKTSVGTKGFQFGAQDWEKYHTLPAYPYPEVEEGSLVTVAFTITGFRGSTSTHHTVHFNALFAIVLGKVDM